MNKSQQFLEIIRRLDYVTMQNREILRILKRLDDIIPQKTEETREFENIADFVNNFIQEFPLSSEEIPQ